MKLAKIKRYRSLFVHLVLSVGLLGAFCVYLINLPLLVLSRVSRRAWLISGRITLMGLHTLRFFQPWWRGEIQVNLPAEVHANQKGCLCVANHRSHLDVFLLLEQVSCLRVLTKHLIFFVPGLGGAAFLMRMILIKRGDNSSFWKAMGKVERALREKDTVLVFPEMTRVEFGQTQLNRFTLAPFQKAILTGVPVVPIAIWGTDYLWPKGIFRIASKGPLVIKSLDPVDSQKFTNAADLSNHVKEKIQQAVNELSQAYPYGELS